MIIIPVSQYESGFHTFTMLNENGVPVAAAGLDSFTLTLYDEMTGTIINSRNNQNILNANNVTISSLGVVVWEWLPLDQPIINSGWSVETHYGLYIAKWTDINSLPRQLSHLVRFDVAQVTNVN